MSVQDGDSHGCGQGAQLVPSQTSLCGHQDSSLGRGGGNLRIHSQLVRSRRGLEPPKCSWCPEWGRSSGGLHWPRGWCQSPTAHSPRAQEPRPGQSCDHPQVSAQHFKGPGATPWGEAGPPAQPLARAVEGWVSRPNISPVTASQLWKQNSHIRFIFLFFCGHMRNISSLTRDRTQTSCNGSTES